MQILVVSNGDTIIDVVTLGNDYSTVSEYPMHVPISIVGNSELSMWPGSGTEEDPYVIQGRNIIDNSICIEIISTTAYFEIRNCWISADSPSGNPGIHFQSVTHGSIINCIIDSHEDGILVEVSDDCSVIDNIIANNSQNGIYLYGVDGCILMNNIASNSRNGISVQYTYDCTLINNTAIDNIDGFYLNDDRGICTFMDNTAINSIDDGVYIKDCDSLNLTNNIVSGCDEGFVLWSSSSCILENNTSTDSYNTGFYLYGASGSTLMNNKVTNSRQGFYFYLTSSCSLVNNSLSNTGIVISGTSTSNWLHTMSNNWVNNKPLGYFRDLASVSIDASSYGQVILANCINVVLENAVVHNASRGFQVGYSTGCRLTNNTSSCNIYGFYLWGSTNCIISDSIALNSSIYGFLIDNSPSSILSNNTAFNSEDGFHVEESDYCNLTSNIAITSLGEGIYIHWSDNCILASNFVSDSEEGIDISVSYYCTLTGNIAASNGQGFILFHCIDSELINNMATNNVEQGFYLTTDSYTLTNNSAINNLGDGFYLDSCGTSILTNNTASNNADDGFDMKSTIVTLANNTAINNYAAGVNLRGSPATLVSNTFVNNGLVISSSALSYWLNDMSNNWVNEKPLGYFRDLVGDSIDASLYGQVILANCIDVIVQQAHVNNATIGIQLGFCTNCTVKNSTANAHSITGFRLMYSEGCILTNNTATDNTNYGLYIHSSIGCTISNNTAIDNDGGIYLYASSSCTLTDNTLEQNGLVIVGSDRSYWLHSLSDNWVNEKPLGYFRDLVGTAINANLYGQVILANCSLVTVLEGSINDTTIGFQLGYSEDCILTNNMASSNKYGFYLWESTACVLTGNTASSNIDYGFFLQTSTNCHLDDNLALSNMKDGFYISDSDICNMTDNRANSNHNNGFYISGSDNCILTNNTAAENSEDGFYLVSSTDCIISDCSAVENNFGFKLWICYWSILTGNSASNNLHTGFNVTVVSYGLFTGNIATDNSEDGIFILDTLNNYTVTDNIITNNLGTGIHLGPGNMESYIYYNVLEGNGNNAKDDGNSNIWDDGGSLGNYWGDFDGSEFYSIPGSAGSKDRYPYHSDAYYSVALDHPENIVYECGEIGYSIVWHPSDPYPNSFEILREGSQIVTDSWNGSTIGINVDGLSVGTYNYTLIVYDTSDLSASDTVLVTVIDTTAPIINHPDDIQYVVESMSQTINWTVSDLNPNSYEIYRNESIVASDIWSSGNINYDVGNLAVGSYNFTILVFDTSDNEASDTVFVTITSSDTTITDTTITTTTSFSSPTTSTTNETEGPPILLYIAGIGSSVGIVIILVIVYIKKRN